MTGLSELKRVINVNNLLATLLTTLAGIILLNLGASNFELVLWYIIFFMVVALVYILMRVLAYKDLLPNNPEIDLFYWLLKFLFKW